MLGVLSERRSAKLPLSSLFEFQAEKKNAFSARTISTQAHLPSDGSHKAGLPPMNLLLT